MKLKVGMIFIKNNGEKREIISIDKESCSNSCSNRCKGNLQLQYLNSGKKYECCIRNILERIKRGYYKLLKNNVRKVK